MDSPPEKVFKLNFDSASKGNPGKSGFDGVIRDHNEEIIHLFYDNMGLDSNNAAEPEGMVVGVTIVVRRNILPLIVEGDRTIILPWIPKFTMAHQFPKSPPVGASCMV